MKNIQFVTGVHGNETMPTLALASMGVDQIVANPMAIANNVRFTEKDLNASFGTGGKTYEENRAREILNIIDPKKLVIDIHTFSCKSEPFAIVVSLDMLPLAMSLGVKHVVYMKHNIKGGHALINHVNGVSIEVGEHVQPESFDKTLQIVRRLKKNGVKPVINRVYAVYGRIEEKGAYTNFVEREGMIPVLYGERAYPDQGFYGLAAREITGTISI